MSSPTATKVTDRQMQEWLYTPVPKNHAFANAIREKIIAYDIIVRASEANHLAKIEAIKERDALKECNNKYFTFMLELVVELENLRTKYRTAIDNLKSAEARVAILMLYKENKPCGNIKEQKNG